MFPSHPTTGSARTMGRDQYAQFEQTRSRVIRIFNLPADASSVLASAFGGGGSAHRPVSFWKLRDGDEHSVWAVFATHEEAAAALALSGANLSIATALDSDLLGSLDRLKRVLHPRMDEYAYTLSSNPPNPRHGANAFRHGDWLCPQPHCAVHNFSRNVVCISCGGPRPALQPLPPPPMASLPPFLQQQQQQQHAPMQSPRFVVAAAVAAVAPPAPSPLVAAMQLASQKGQSLLTPSGRAFSVGGKVLNVSHDPLAPCIIFWPDNEPLPDQGQIRPSMSGSVQPPILNTGNKGPIEHQPGDWVCQRCDYHNWRRRKVCQTCYPFAEGNSDNVTAAAQQDRINLLASLLAQQHAAAAQAHAGAVQFGSPFSSQATPVPSALPPPPPPPYQLPEPSPKSNVPGLMPLGMLPPGVPTPPNESLDYGYGNGLGLGFAARASVSAAVQASRLTRFASTPSLRAHWPPGHAQAQQQQLTSSSSSSSPQRTPLSASYLQTTHSISLPHGHRPPPLAPVSIGQYGSYSAGPASAKSDSFSFASSSSDFELPPIPQAPGTRTVSGPLLGGRAYGSVAALQMGGMGGQLACPPQRHTASLDLDAFRLGLRLGDDDEDGHRGGTLLEGGEEDDEQEFSRPGTGTSHSLTGTGSRSASSRSSVDSPQARVMGSLPNAHAGGSQAFWARGPDGRAASIAALSPWTDPTRNPRGLAGVALNGRLGPIGSGRSAIGGSGSSPTSANSTSSVGGQGNYVLVNIGK